MGRDERLGPADAGTAYLAFLDQRTIELEFAMRIGEPETEPCETDEILRCDLILKLGIVPE